MRLSWPSKDPEDYRARQRNAPSTFRGRPDGEVRLPDPVALARVGDVVRVGLLTSALCFVTGLATFAVADPSEMPEVILGTVAGGLVWAAHHYWFSTRRLLPRGIVASAPAHIGWDEPAPGYDAQGAAFAILGVIALAVAITSLLPPIAAGMIVAGQFAGTGLANLHGRRLIRGWEHRHGRRLGMLGSGDDIKLYAG